jgi:hypothetical protein
MGMIRPRFNPDHARHARRPPSTVQREAAGATGRERSCKLYAAQRRMVWTSALAVLYGVPVAASAFQLDLGYDSTHVMPCMRRA